MRVDPEVCARKYAAEVESLRSQEETLHKWGCFVMATDFPQIDVMFVPAHPLSFVVQQPVSALLGANGQPMVEQRLVPIPALAARAFGARIGLDEYDHRPPSVCFMDPFTWQLLPFQLCPKGMFIPPDGGPPNTVVLEGHAGLSRPFLCLRGIREYHEHPQHAGDDWAAIRAHAGVFHVLQWIWQTCVQQVRPILFHNNNQLGLNWSPVQGG